MDPPQKPTNPQKPPTYILHSTQLPQIDSPSQSHHPKFYKQKSRITETHLNIQLGLLILEYQHYQQDFITYLTNLLMCQVQFLSVSIVDPMFLYISGNLMVEAQGAEGQGCQYLEMESDLYFVLDFARERVLEFLRQYTSEDVVFGENNTSSQEIIEKFQEKCIKPINEMHAKIFNKDDL